MRLRRPTPARRDLPYIEGPVHPEWIPGLHRIRPLIKRRLTDPQDTVGCPLTSPRRGEGGGYARDAWSVCADELLGIGPGGPAAVNDQRLGGTQQETPCVRA